MFIFHKDKNKFEVIKQGHCPTEIASKEECLEAANWLYTNFDQRDFETIKYDDMPPGCLRAFIDPDAMVIGIIGKLIRFKWNEAKTNNQCGKLLAGPLSELGGLSGSVEYDCVCGKSPGPGNY